MDGSLSSSYMYIISVSQCFEQEKECPGNCGRHGCAETGGCRLQVAGCRLQVAGCWRRASARWLIVMGNFECTEAQQEWLLLR